MTEGCFLCKSVLGLPIILLKSNVNYGVGCSTCLWQIGKRILEHFKGKRNRTWQIKEPWAVLTFLKRPFIRWINVFLAREETGCYLWQQQRARRGGLALAREEGDVFICPVTLLKEIDSCWPVAYLKIASLAQRSKLQSNNIGTGKSKCLQTVTSGHLQFRLIYHREHIRSYLFLIE